MSFPLSVISPEIRLLGGDGSNEIKLIAVTLFPQPLSPIKARLFPFSNEKVSDYRSKLSAIAAS